ncbi:redoxin family protein [Agromyces sp. ISL-38]|uniref:TlpA family protein disulfide reductase n=1 Tax=Agromyces sp. ISL-38 TaxID=2819107 RepID=UPI001BE510B0|nr:redoxin family protein [Agromyces sp. ISL-38]MBT2500068.1 redoxin family protein [Agromyces sp. ISL-38]
MESPQLNVVELTVAIAILILLLLNLLLTYGVVRRLREHGTRLSKVEAGGNGGGADSLGPASPAPGTSVPSFEAAAVDGSVVSSATTSQGEKYMGFFSPTCAPCRERLPEFISFAQRRSPDDVVVIIQDGDGASEMAAAATGVARVIIDDGPGGQLIESFQVDRFPTLIALQDGVVTTNTSIMGGLPSELVR